MHLGFLCGAKIAFAPGCFLNPLVAILVPPQDEYGLPKDGREYVMIPNPGSRSLCRQVVAVVFERYHKPRPIASK